MYDPLPSQEREIDRRRRGVLAMLDESMIRLQREAFEMGALMHRAELSRLATIRANIDNKELSDAEFRRLVRSCTP